MSGLPLLCAALSLDHFSLSCFFASLAAFPTTRPHNRIWSPIQSFHAVCPASSPDPMYQRLLQTAGQCWLGPVSGSKIKRGSWCRGQNWAVGQGLTPRETSILPGHPPLRNALYGRADSEGQIRLRPAPGSRELGSGHGNNHGEES